MVVVCLMIAEKVSLRFLLGGLCAPTTTAWYSRGNRRVKRRVGSTDKTRNVVFVDDGRSSGKDGTLGEFSTRIRSLDDVNQ